MINSGTLSGLEHKPTPASDHAARLLAEAAVMASLHKCSAVQVADALWAAGVPSDVGGVAALIAEALEQSLPDAYRVVWEAAQEGTA